MNKFYVGVIALISTTVTNVFAVDQEEWVYFKDGITVDGTSTFNTSAFFNGQFATRNNDGQLSTIIDSDGFYTSKEFRLYTTCVREKYYKHLTIGGIDANDKPTSFFISTQNEEMGNISYYPLNFIAQDYMFEGSSLSFKKMGGKSPVVSLSDDGTVSAGALSLRGGGSDVLDIKYDGLSSWILEANNMNVKGKVSFDGDVSLKDLSGEKISGESLYSFGSITGKYISSETLTLDGALTATKEFTLYGKKNEGGVYYPKFRILGREDENANPNDNTDFIITTKNGTPGGGTALYTLNFEARNFDFAGSSLSFRKMDDETPAIVLTDTGYVSAKGLSLNAGSTTGSTLTLSPKEDDSWSLNATKGTGDDATPAALDVNASDLNVKGNLVCESGFTALGSVSFNKGISASDIYSTNGVRSVGGYTLYSLPSKYTSQLAILANKDAERSYFSITTQYVTPGGTFYSPLSIEADTIDFVGSSFSFKKTGATEPAIVLSDTGVVAAKGLFLSAKSASEPGLKISSSADGSWELSALKLGETPAPAPLNMNVSSLNVNGPIVCKDQMKVASVETGVLRANDVTVNLNNAADYVFDENYDLKSLEEVESFVKENKHLPGVPSASQLEEKGMSVSEMSNLLLEKVEELTLHLIRVEKENRALKAEVEKLNEMLNK